MSKIQIHTPTDYIKSGHITPEVIAETFDILIKFLAENGIKAIASKDKEYDFVYNLNIEGEILPRTIWEMFKPDDTIIRDNTYSLETFYTKGSSLANPFISYSIDEPDNEIYNNTGLYQYEFILNDGVFLRPSHTNYDDNQYPGRFKENFPLPLSMPTTSPMFQTQKYYVKILEKGNTPVKLIQLLKKLFVYNTTEAKEITDLIPTRIQEFYDEKSAKELLILLEETGAKAEIETEKSKNF